MVQKIQSSGYLKRLSNMTVAERQAYMDRVGEWLRNGSRLLVNRTEDFDARLQNVMTASVGWNDAECEAFEEGARLLSSLMGTSDTWLPELLYKKAARRSIRQMFSTLSAVAGAAGAASEKREVKSEVPEKEKGKEPAAAKPQPAEKPAEAKAQPTKKGEGPAASSVTAGVPVRPRHIDQYVHLLPKKTQEHAAEVRDLLRQLDDAREKARLLMNDAQASPDSRAQWARRATQLDDKVRSIYKELDAEWEKLVKQGRVVVDIFGNASIAPDGEPSDTVAQEEKPELTSEQKARRRELRKWLIDTRRGAEGKAREKRIEQWKENWKEYLTLEPLEAAMKDEKIVAAAQHFGIEIVES